MEQKPRPVTPQQAAAGNIRMVGEYLASHADDLITKGALHSESRIRLEIEVTKDCALVDVGQHLVFFEGYEDYVGRKKA